MVWYTRTGCAVCTFTIQKWLSVTKYRLEKRLYDKATKRHKKVMYLGRYKQEGAVSLQMPKPPCAIFTCLPTNSLIYRKVGRYIFIDMIHMRINMHL